MPQFDSIPKLADLRAMTVEEAERLAPRIRALLVDTVTRTGGHLGPNLGVVELTIALHRVFESPRDQILWDTGHQAYVHKLLTGRGDAFDSLRQSGGLSGYPSRAESAHDFIENSHASTALAYADGLAKAHAIRGVTDRAVVAVVGDGALTGGMAWEALNNIAGAPERPVVIILNDNGRSYAPTVGGLAEYLSVLRGQGASRTIFDHLGIRYLGPVDGHDIAAVEEALRRAVVVRKPVVVHCVTQKGRGHAPAEQDPADRQHAVSARTTGEPSRGPSWTEVFGAELAELGERRPDLVAITAAMLGPTGLSEFARRFPDRTFDVGIAEQHALTSAAGLALGGMHPVVALYATFLNRAFDQLLLDVALHRAPVTIALDRAGVTGVDGPSHNGMWDLSVLQVVPGLRLAVPRDAESLRCALREAVQVDDGPTVVRFPKGDARAGVPAVGMVGGMDLLREGVDRDVLIVSVGAVADICLGVADRLVEHGFCATVVDPRWIKPVPPELLALGQTYRLVATVEDNGRVGGAGAATVQALIDAGARIPMRTFGLAQRFLQHGSRGEVLADGGLSSQLISRELVEALAGQESAQPIAVEQH